MKISDKAVVQLIVDQCRSFGVRHVVFSPGSRNAPFALSFDDKPFFTTHVIHDERVAGFYAIGLAQECNEPVALCCTSGSAVVNYFPAITEAYYRQIPLLVLSADRPKELINKGHGQTIMQHGIFGAHVLSHLSLEDIDAKRFEDAKYLNRTHECFSKLVSSPKGPVHINVHLNEPLYGQAAYLPSYVKEMNPPENSANEYELGADLIKELKGKKILVVCGQDKQNKELNRELIRFNQDENVLVLNENISGLNDSSFVNCIDRTLNSIPKENNDAYRPQVVITIGGALISKRIKAFLVENKPDFHLAINSSDIGIDTFHSLSMHLRIPALVFFQAANSSMLGDDNTQFDGLWKKIDHYAKEQLEPFFDQENSDTDIRVFHCIQKHLRKFDAVHLANSSVVRYMQLFDPVESLQYESNRGTSGIDGSLSTALGSAVASPGKKHLHITGDISFIYDSNALWTRPYPENLKIIVIDNKGGGIFRIIDGARTSAQLERYFEAKHNAAPEKIAKAFGLECTEVDNFTTFEKSLAEFLNDTKRKVLVVKTDAGENPHALERFFNTVRNA